MTRFAEPIYVTRPYLPPLDDFTSGCQEVWNSKWLSNNGPMLRRFHTALAAYMGVSDGNLALFNNGTSALELAYQVLGLAGGEVITTPFTFVATSHALVRAGARPVFADIDPETLCMDPAKVEQLIRPGITKAIVPVHVYGHVCDVDGFRQLSDKYGIPVIYDAAHAFGIQGIERHGAMSMFSFHPTKLFHSCEGGLLVFNDASFRARLDELRDFGIRSESMCVEVGMNAKMNELQALMGLKCLEHIDELVASRLQVYEAYRRVFEHASPNVALLSKSVNHAYVPVLFRDGATRDLVYEELKKSNIMSRKYFYPILTDFPPYAYAEDTCPVAADAAARVLALPTYFGLSDEDVESIARNVCEIVG